MYRAITPRQRSALEVESFRDEHSSATQTCCRGDPSRSRLHRGPSNILVSIASCRVNTPASALRLVNYTEPSVGGVSGCLHVAAAAATVAEKRARDKIALGGAVAVSGASPRQTRPRGRGQRLPAWSSGRAVRAYLSRYGRSCPSGTEPAAPRPSLPAGRLAAWWRRLPNFSNRSSEADDFQPPSTSRLTFQFFRSTHMSRLLNVNAPWTAMFTFNFCLNGVADHRLYFLFVIYNYNRSIIDRSLGIDVVER